MQNEPFIIDAGIDEYIKMILDNYPLAFDRKSFDEWFDFIESKKDAKGFIDGKWIAAIRNKAWEIIKRHPKYKDRQPIKIETSLPQK